KNHKILGITLFATYDKCHAWVIDGYLTKELKYKAQIGMRVYNMVSSENYLHHNWGWNGSDNGYYASGIFNTNIVPDFESNTKAGEPYNYQYKVKVVPNIYK
ncbi:MAG: C10 family peptidase, partial [Fibrobacter sp.]|nr:C10 family peptidase [Fibrobacter sp.]